MESTEKKEALMRIKAASKNELYRKLFDQYGTDYYYVVDESVKRNIPFFWKKNYEMLVAFPEDKQEEVNEGTAQFHEQLMDVVNEPSEQIMKANGIQSVLHNLENVTTPMSYAAMQTGNSEEWARKKEKLLKLFEKGIVVVKQTEETKVTKKQKAVKKVAPVNKEEVVVKKEKQKSVPFIIQKVIRMLEQNDVEQYFIHAYAEKLKVKFENATMITEEEVIEYILEDMRSHFNTENVFEKEVQTIALIGPTGVGKTTTLAKMAWQFHGKKKTVRFHYDRPFSHWDSSATARLRKDNWI